MIHPHLQAEAAKNGALIGGLAPMRRYPKKLPPAVSRDLSTTTVALVMLRFNVALQIALFAIVVNLLLSLATFWYGLNSLYCAFGMDCLIGVVTACILVWRFASSKTAHLNQTQAHVYLLHSYSDTLPYRKSSTTLLPPVSKYELLETSLREDTTTHSRLDAPNDHLRELWSTFWLGQVMILAGLIVIARTVVEIVTHALVVASATESSDLDRVDYGFEGATSVPVHHLESTYMSPLYTLATISLALNLLLMFAKLLVYLFLRSNSMLIEGVNSFISALFAAVTMASIAYSGSVAYADQIVSILFGLFLILYGGYSVFVSMGETVYQVVKKCQRPQGYETLV